MRPLLLTDADVFAGTERHMLDLALGLRELGIAPIVACPSRGTLARRATQQRLQVIAIEKRGQIDIAAAVKLRRLLQNRIVDIIHAHNGRTCFAAAIATCLARRGALVTTAHFIAPARARRRGPAAWLSRTLHRWLDGQVDHTIAISTAVADALATTRTQPIAADRILHGIEPAAQQQQSRAQRAELRQSLGAADRPLVLCPARLQPEKHVDVVIEALALLRGRGRAAVCCVAGDGTLRAGLDRMITQKQLGHDVRLLGFRNDVDQLMAAADVVVLPSPAEPFGLVLLEAMAQGTPVVAARAGGPLDIVVEGETGLFFEPGDAASLARAIETMIADDAKRRAMGEAGRRRLATHFTRHRMAEQTLAVYRAALDRRTDAATTAKPKTA